MQQNPFVEYLNRYTTVSPEHEAAFDEFISKTTPPSGQSLHLDTKIEKFIKTRFQQGHLPSIILTGNAGDGKTYLCRRIVERFSGKPFQGWGDQSLQTVSDESQTLQVVKDLSEVGEEQGVDILKNLNTAFLQNDKSNVFLIAANEGRLRALLSKASFNNLSEEINNQLNEGPNLDNPNLLVINLNRVTTSSYLQQTLEWMTDPSNWDACQNCPAFNNCPIRFNASRMRDLVINRLKTLYQVLEHLNIHVTIRDLLIHLAYTITGGLNCQRVIKSYQKFDWDGYKFVYYENVWGTQASETFRRKVVVLNHLQQLNPGDQSIFEIDNFIVNDHSEGNLEYIAYQTLFGQPSVDLNNNRFIQDRNNYLKGSDNPNKVGEEPPLLDWMSHCRRKLYFEINNDAQAYKLVPLLFFTKYLDLLLDKKNALENAKRELVLGLNRAFSRLYLTDASSLFVPSQFSNTVEQPVPIIQAKIPTDHIELKVTDLTTEAYDNDLRNLVLVIPPPPKVKSDEVSFSLNLLIFEYLVRLASGGTYNILSKECELAIRKLKDQLISKFTNTKESGERQIEFFAAYKNRYVLRQIWLDDDGKIQV